MPGAFKQSIDFFFRQEVAHICCQGARPFQVRYQAAQVIDQVGRNLFPGKIPNHGAQLVIRIETNPVVDQPEVIVRIYQDVPTFAVSIVGNDVK